MTNPHSRLRALAVPAAALLLLLSAAAGVAAQGKAYPVDEGASDPAFAKFRTELLDAIVRRDVDGVVAAAAKDVMLSFGGHAGRDDFRGFLTLSEKDLADEFKHEAAERRESYWDGLEEVLRLGGRFTAPGTFEAPYTWTVKLDDTSDPFRTFFAMGDGIPVRDRPSRFGNVVSTLDHDILETVDGGEGTPFLNVKLPGGGTGFVARQDLRSAVDFRAIFRKRDGRWEIDMFIRGD